MKKIFYMILATILLGCSACENTKPKFARIGNFSLMLPANYELRYSSEDSLKGVILVNGQEVAEITKGYIPSDFLNKQSSEFTRSDSTGKYNIDEIIVMEGANKSSITIFITAKSLKIDIFDKPRIYGVIVSSLVNDNQKVQDLRKVISKLKYD